jgi:hypothetical protein
MKNYNIVSFTNNENKTIYFSHIVDLGEFGKSLAMTPNKDEAMKFSDESEATRYARAYSKRAIVETISI